MAELHPALALPAGLTSGLAHVAHNRWDPVKESNDYSDHFSERRVKNQVALPVPNMSTAYTNGDIEFSHPTNRPLLACNGLPRNFKTGSRCVNPLEPRYILPGCSPQTGSPAGPATAASSPKASSGGYASELSPTAPGPRRPGSDRLLVPAMSLPRVGDAAGAVASPKLQPLPHSPSGSQGAGGTLGQQQHPNSNTYLNTNGAVGGLLLYGPAVPAPPAAPAAAAGNRSLDVTDINGQRRSTSVPLRRNGAFDPLNVSDIVPHRNVSPTRQLNCLTTGDISGAHPRARTRDVPSPGHGTLNSADISGAAPGCLARASPTTYAIGRWPAPSVPTYQFAHSTRVTMIKKPIAIAE